MKKFNYKVLNLAKQYNFCIGCLRLRFFEKFKNLNLKICEFKINIWDKKQQIKKLSMAEYMQIGSFNSWFSYSSIPGSRIVQWQLFWITCFFGANYMNIQGHLEIPFWILKTMNLIKHIFGTINNFKPKLFNYKVVNCIQNYNFAVDYVNIRGYLKISNFKINEHKTIFRTLNNLKKNFST
jgi:hypothetical protein